MDSFVALLLLLLAQLVELEKHVVREDMFRGRSSLCG
jgi:hypothetical protein